MLTYVFAALTLLSVGLLVWQFLAAARFPLHQRRSETDFAPDISLLKPLKGADEHTAACLRSWFEQSYAGKIQLLFGVADPEDPVCAVVRSLMVEFPQADAQLVFARELLGPNAKVSTLTQLAPHVRHGLVAVSDADVRVPREFLAQAVAPLREPQTGLVNCFYQMANPCTPAMQWETVAVNADFWSQVLQSNTLKPQDFALGAVMITRRESLEQIGGFASLVDYLADDYELGHRLARTGARIALCPVVVECWDRPMNFPAVWRHQLRWARTIRVSQPVPYFFSLLSNVSLWAVLWSLSLLGQIQGSGRGPMNEMLFRTALMVLLPPLFCRVTVALHLARRLTGRPVSPFLAVYVLAKDFLQVGIWAMAFLGNTIEWRGQKFRLARGGRMIPVGKSA